MRDRLISLGWTPPKKDNQVVMPICPYSKTQMELVGLDNGMNEIQYNNYTHLCEATEEG